MDPGQIATLLSSFNAMTTIARGMVDVRDATVMQGKVLELQREIIAAQSAAMSTQTAFLALTQQTEDLKNQLATLRAWDNERLRYKLTDHGDETFAWVLQPEHANGEAVHRLCTTCFAAGKKSILISERRNIYGQTSYRCGPCNRVVDLGPRGEPRQPRVRTSRYE